MELLEHGSTGDLYILGPRGLDGPIHPDDVLHPDGSVRADWAYRCVWDMSIDRIPWFMGEPWRGVAES